MKNQNRSKEAYLIDEINLKQQGRLRASLVVSEQNSFIYSIYKPFHLSLQTLHRPAL